ncbi:MAG: hypothetical protein JXM68_00430 [Sedimentisphaerales bacterium]|nr:hypothetical protein [Sedimentisphaerales bacterium]
MHKKLNNIISSSVREGLATIDTATTVIRKDRSLQTSHNLAVVSDISRHIGILIYYDRMVSKQVEASDFDMVIAQVENSISHIHSGVLDLAMNCLSSS